MNDEHCIRSMDSCVESNLKSELLVAQYSFFAQVNLVVSLHNFVD